jgi:hypothetical protein
MKKTFVDAGVLIAAARGTTAVSAEALKIFADPDREFASSIFVKLEVLPKCIFNKRQPEAEFFEAFFESVTDWADQLDALVNDAYNEASLYGLSAVDALHVAAAKLVGADELVTTEKSGTPLHRVTSVSIVTIQPG